MKRIAVLMALLSLPPCSTAAQEVNSAQARVRISAIVFGTDSLQLIGTLIQLGNDTVVIEPQWERSRVAVPMGSIRRIEMSDGPRRKTGKGALYGFLGGVVIGAGSVVVLCALEENGCTSAGSTLLSGDLTAPGAVAAGLALGLLGTGIGALIGSTVHTERWQELHLDRLRLGFGGFQRIRAGIALPSR